MIFEKIRERLQEARNQLEKSCVKVRSKEDCEKHTECGACIMDCAIEIVNEVETEYKEEYKSKCAECTRRKFYMMGYQAAKQNNGWILCSERLPEDDATVWATYIDNGKKLTATAYHDWESGYWYVGYFDYKTKNVTHWQPLPQPPKGE